MGYDDEFKIIGGSMTQFSLELSRVCSERIEENFHIFRYLMAGLPDHLKESFYLKEINFTVSLHVFKLLVVSHY